VGIGTGIGRPASGFDEPVVDFDDVDRLLVGLGVAVGVGVAVGDAEASAGVATTEEALDEPVVPALAGTATATRLVAMRAAAKS
jgi:hypothetical protein